MLVELAFVAMWPVPANEQEEGSPTENFAEPEFPGEFVGDSDDTIMSSCEIESVEVSSDPMSDFYLLLTFLLLATLCASFNLFFSIYFV